MIENKETDERKEYEKKEKLNIDMDVEPGYEPINGEEVAQAIKEIVNRTNGFMSALFEGTPIIISHYGHKAKETAKETAQKTSSQVKETYSNVKDSTVEKITKIKEEKENSLSIEYKELKKENEQLKRELDLYKERTEMLEEKLIEAMERYNGVIDYMCKKS